MVDILVVLFGFLGVFLGLPIFLFWLSKNFGPNKKSD